MTQGNLLDLIVTGGVIYSLCEGGKWLQQKAHEKSELKEWMSRNNDHLLDGLMESIRGHQKKEKQSRYDKKREAFNEAQAFYSSPEWRKLRYQALKMYGGRCAACGVTANHGFVMHVDHIKPRSKFPHLALDITNLQVLCEDCNKAKSNTDDIKWRN